MTATTTTAPPAAPTIAGGAIKRIRTNNFRLLNDVTMHVHPDTTVVVGRNNSGKTSLTELFRRLFSDLSPSFRLEDFSLSTHELFWRAYRLARQGAEEVRIRAALPTISVELTVEYDPASPAFSLFSPFVVDLDDTCRRIQLNLRFQLKDGATTTLFKDIEADPDSPSPENKTILCRALRERLPQSYELVVEAVDPNDSTNRIRTELAKVRALIRGGFIGAQRGLDDTTHKDINLLGKILETLLTSAASDSAAPPEHTTAQDLATAVKSIQTSLDGDFKSKLEGLLPAFALFGYPGLHASPLITETTLDVQRLLSNHTRVNYTGANGVHLPESYNGLGTRNLVYILLKLYEFFRLFQTSLVQPAVHFVFIEEPEVHLHPQMQEVFIAQLKAIAKVFVERYNGGVPWPVQFVVTTHSSHIANKAPFECTRYFLAKERDVVYSVEPDAPTPTGATPTGATPTGATPTGATPTGAAPTGDPSQLTIRARSTVIKNIDDGLTGMHPDDQKFLHQYMTLTRCDLLFADKAILVEGAVERLLLPRMISRLGAGSPSPLSSQYVSTVEVGGAYAHLFFDLLNFLELPTLIITDIDSVSGTDRTKCPVATGTHTSNACITSWFDNTDISPAELIAKSDAAKTIGDRRLAYEIPENTDDPCGRSFEDAFILANPTLFELSTIALTERGQLAYDKAAKLKKTDFAIKHLLSTSEWVTPKYLVDGLQWLSTATPIRLPPAAPPAPAATTPPQEAQT